MILIVVGELWTPHSILQNSALIVWLDLQLQMDAESLMQTAACVKLCVKHDYVDDVL